MLHVKKLNAYYGSAHVLFDVSLHIQGGEFVGLFGRNGAGKTTLFRALMGLTPPAIDGEIVFNNEDIVGLAPHQIANKGLGWVPEDRKIFPNITVRKNLLLGVKAPKYQRKTSRVFGGEEAYKYFPKLYEMRDKLGNQMSGGEQQMLTVARTMMGNPELVLLDEPTEGLAPNTAKDLLNMILEIRRDFNLTAVVVEQFSPQLLKHLDRCYVMEMGEIIFEGSPLVLAEDEALQRKLLGVG